MCGDSSSAAACDYLETMDLTNNTNVGGTAENHQPHVRNITGRHAYTLSVAAAGEATLMLSATEPPSLSDHAHARQVRSSELNKCAFWSM